MYSSRYIMGQVTANASPIANAFDALTVAPQPALSYMEHWLFDTKDQAVVNDDDGRVDAGETIDLSIVIRNHWGKADMAEAIYTMQKVAGLRSCEKEILSTVGFMRFFSKQQ